MHATLLPIALALTCLGLSSPSTQDPPKAATDAPAPAAAREAPAKLDPALLGRMEWLCGTWVAQDGAKTTEEHWRPLQGTTILGSSHTYDATRTLFFEHLRITAMRGTIAYVALPGGANGTAFVLKQVEDGLMVFENERHDHPQRIRYERTESGMTATVGQLDGSRSQTFVFTRKP